MTAVGLARGDTADTISSHHQMREEGESDGEAGGRGCGSASLTHSLTITLSGCCGCALPPRAHSRRDQVEVRKRGREGEGHRGDSRGGDADKHTHFGA